MEDYIRRKWDLARQYASMAGNRMGNVASDMGNIVQPVAGRISQYFGNYNPGLYKGVTKGAKHMGLDIATPMGTPVYAPFGSRVTRGNDPKGWGNYVQLTDPTGRVFQLSHLQRFADDLGENVARGGLLGYSGSTGRSTGPHVDLSVRQNGNYIDPLSIDAIKRAYVNSVTKGGA